MSGEQVDFDGQLVAFAEDLRSEGVVVGTSELLDAFKALELVRWSSPGEFRETLATTIAKSPEDRRLFDLVFERFFFRATEMQAVRMEVSEPQTRVGVGRRGEPKREIPAARESCDDHHARHLPHDDFAQRFAHQDDVIVDGKGGTPTRLDFEAAQRGRHASIRRLPQDVFELIAAAAARGDIADEHIRGNPVVEVRHLAPDETGIERGAREAAARDVGQPERSLRHPRRGHGPCAGRRASAQSGSDCGRQGRAKLGGGGEPVGDHFLERRQHDGIHRFGNHIATGS